MKSTKLLRCSVNENWNTYKRPLKRKKKRMVKSNYYDYERDLENWFLKEALTEAERKSALIRRMLILNATSATWTAKLLEKNSHSILKSWNMILKNEDNKRTKKKE